MLHPRSARSVRVSWCTLIFFVMLSLAPALPVGASSINIADEVAIIHKAYSTLMISLYEPPDSVALLTAAHATAERELNASLALDPLTGDPEQQFNLFAGNLQTLAAIAPPNTLAKGLFAHRVIREMAKAVGDLHTYFMDEQASSAELRRLRGDTSIVNFGMVGMNENGEYYVKQVVNNSPVNGAGLRPGDHVLALDGQSVNWDNHNEVLSNPIDGQTYSLRVRHAHANADSMLSVRMQRYSRETLSYAVVNGHIGYVRAFAFYSDLPEKLDSALDALHRQGVDSLLIDFRGNGGGANVNEVVGRFLPDGTAFGRSEGRSENLEFIAHAGPRPVETLPLAVLVDETSGSASEIAALALHDFRGARLIGTKTAGALGIVRFADLGDTTLLAITTSAYVSAKGARLNKIGVMPDVVTDRSMDEVLSGADPQMDTACGELTKIVGIPAALPHAA